MMKTLLFASAIGLALMIPGVSDAAQKVQGPVARAANNQTAVACNFCFTCGGDWTVFAGSIRSVGDTPVERGGSCSGSLISRVDSSPFLCCR